MVCGDSKTVRCSYRKTTTTNAIAVTTTMCPTEKIKCRCMEANTIISVAAKNWVPGTFNIHNLQVIINELDELRDV